MISSATSVKNWTLTGFGQVPDFHRMIFGMSKLAQRIRVVQNTKLVQSIQKVTPRRQSLGHTSTWKRSA